MAPIPTYVMNLRKRTDRRESILRQFAGREEFDLEIVDAIEHSTGAIGLWETLKHIINGARAEYILLCEDDHHFTEYYSTEILLDSIGKAVERNADILCGGVSWFEDSLQVSEGLFSVERFSGLQFTVIFRKFFPTILQAAFGPKDVADYKISQLSKDKLVIHPFISIQKEFGYSDVTQINNTEGRVDELFSKSDEHLQRLKEVQAFYKNKPVPSEHAIDYSGIVLPVYAVHQPEKAEGLQAQFSGRTEFDVTYVPAGEQSRWLNIRKVAEMALAADDDVIVLCDDGHVFPPDYSADYFLQNVIEAHNQGAVVLAGGVTHFGHALPVTRHCFWTNPFYSTQFVVLYKPIFRLIIDEPFDETVNADEMLSKLTSSKMLLFPFVSVGPEERPGERLADLLSTYNRLIVN